MENLIFRPRMYTFLWTIRDCDLEKKILDCGAGGQLPPLAIFHEHGFETHGVDISESQLEKASQFCQEQGIDLNIRKGDMRNLDFEDSSFSHVYSQNSIFHLNKQDTSLAMQEMRRVLRKGGYMFVNFLSIDDQACGDGEPAGLGEWIAPEHGEPTLHSFYEDDEPNAYFEGMNLFSKTKQITDYNNGEYRMVTLEYIAKKV